MRHNNIDTRIIEHAQYYVENSSTVREVAEHFGLSKSQVHIDITKNLKKLNLNLYRQVQEIINKNKKERHIRGGIATKRKYHLIKSTD